MNQCLKPVRLHIQSNSKWKPFFVDSLRSLGQSLGLKIELLVQSAENVPIVKLNSFFLKRLDEQELSWKSNVNKDGNVVFENGAIDHLSSALYKANFLQEYQAEKLDQLGRFRFEWSYQKAIENRFENQVYDHLSKFFEEHNLGLLTDKPSRLFVSHDNDTLYKSLEQNGKYLLNKGRLDLLIPLVFREIFRRPGFMNMDHIMDINDEYDLKSTFFWLVNQGPAVDIVGKRVKNSDYNVSDPAVKKLMDRIKSRGFYQGLHKSISEESFNQELNKLPIEAKTNRNHFLKLQIPEHFKQLDETNIEADFSLGFPDEFGFRNGFGLPYRPFDLDRMKCTNTLFVPLAIMDTSNWSYKKLPLPEMKKQVFELLESNKANAMISVLWHNKYFTSYKFKGYLEVYKSILDYCKETGIKTISERELIDLYRLN